MATDDMVLVREYALNQSERAFETLVSRYINLVYSVAFRQVRDTHRAEEITQAVFIILGRKAKTLGPKTILAGWLCRTARYVAANTLTVERRRQHREQEAYMRSQMNEPESNAWMRIEPVLETAMGQLGEKDHNAIVLRFFEGKSFSDLSTALGTSEDAAKKRVKRALERLRAFFVKRGVTLSAGVIAAAISANSIQAAPIGLATSVTIAAVKGTTVTTSTLTLIKTTLNFMAWTKIKIAAGVSILALLVAGTTGIALHTINARNNIAKASANLDALVFPGYATPESALKSLAWCQATGDEEKALSAVTPAQAEWFKKKIEGKSVDEVRHHMIEEAKIIAAAQVTGKEIISDNEVRLHVHIPADVNHPMGGDNTQVVQKIGQEWKFAGIYGVNFRDKK